MKDFVLLIVVLAAFIYGYFLMEKLDKFLKENQSQKLISDSKLRIGFETPAIIDSIADLLEQFSSEYPNYELNLFYGSVSEIINGLENNKLDFGFIIENSNDILKDEYCSLSFQIKQSVITPGSIDNAVHPINTIEKPARVIWQNDINCMKGLFQLFLDLVYSICTNKLSLITVTGQIVIVAIPDQIKWTDCI